MGQAADVEKMMRDLKGYFGDNARGSSMATNWLRGQISGLTGDQATMPSSSVPVAGTGDLARSAGSGAASRDRRPRMSRDQAEGLLNVIAELLEEKETGAMDALRRRFARDYAPEGGGWPEIGAGASPSPSGGEGNHGPSNEGPGGCSEAYDRRAHDRALESARMGGRSWDVAALSYRGAADQAAPRGMGFTEMFKGAARIRHSF